MKKIIGNIYVGLVLFLLALAGTTGQAQCFRWGMGLDVVPSYIHPYLALEISSTDHHTAHIAVGPTGIKAGGKVYSGGEKWGTTYGIHYRHTGKRPGRELAHAIGGTISAVGHTKRQGKFSLDLGMEVNLKKVQAYPTVGISFTFIIKKIPRREG